MTFTAVVTVLVLGHEDTSTAVGASAFDTETFNSTVIGDLEI